MIKYGIQIDSLLLECKEEVNKNGYCCVNDVIHSHYEKNKPKVEIKSIHDLDFAFEIYNLILKDRKFVKSENKSYTKSTEIHYFVCRNSSYKWEDDKAIIRLIVKPIITTFIGLLIGYLCSRYVFPPNCNTDNENKEMNP